MELEIQLSDLSIPHFKEATPELPDYLEIILAQEFVVGNIEVVKVVFTANPLVDKILVIPTFIANFISNKIK